MYELGKNQMDFWKCFFIPSKSHWATGLFLHLPNLAKINKHKYFHCVTKDQFQGVKILAQKQESQCAQKGGQMLVFVICGFIKNFLPNSYFILQIYHAKSFKK